MGKRKKRSAAKAYKPLLAADRDWDYEFLLLLERKKLQRMAKYFSAPETIKANGTTAKELSICVRLLDIVLGNERFKRIWSDEVSRHLEMRHEKDENGKWNCLEFDYNGMIPDFPKYVNLRNASRFVPSANFPNKEYESDEERKYHTEHFKIDVREAKAWHLYNIIRKYRMFGWWD